MEPNKKNEETARKIINILAEKGHTVEEANSILCYVRNTILTQSTVCEVDGKLF